MVKADDRKYCFNGGKSRVLAGDTIGVAHVTARFLLFFVVYVTFQSANRQKLKEGKTK